MELPKRLFVVTQLDAVYAGGSLNDLPPVLLEDGAEVGVYLLRRIKKVEITRKLKAIEGESEESDTEPDPLPLAPETVPG